MDGWWTCPKLDEFFFRVLRTHLEGELKDWNMIFHYLKSRIFNNQSKSRAIEVAHKHYDISNKLYELMLGTTMAYTCAYWKNATNLDDAENAKFELICQKIGLKKRPGMRILDLGCGFGSFLKYAAEHYQATGVGINISVEQIKYANESCKGLPIEFQLKDYRDVTGSFDAVVSIGLAEHVGYKNYRTLMTVAHNCLHSDEGIFLLHTIGNNSSVTVVDPWIDKYIFPNGMPPSIKQLSGAMEDLFVIEDLHNFGADYDKTLLAWFDNFNAHWDELRHEYDERFYRMWTYYLLSCAGGFRARTVQLWQFVGTKKGIIGGYTSVR